MKIKRLLNAAELEVSPIVANCCMNRERELLGSNSYEMELGFDPLNWLRGRLARHQTVRWLDLCCGSGKALIQAAKLCEGIGVHAIKITGVDLVGMFLASDSPHLQLVQCSIFEYKPVERFDLITCVHGLHYLGDKLQAIRLAASWLVSDGRYVANLDPQDLCLSESGQGQRRIVRFLRDQGFEYLSAKHILQRTGHKQLKIPFPFRGPTIPLAQTTRSNRL